MGCCINRLDSIEHATDLSDVISVIKLDKDLFLEQLHIVIKDIYLIEDVKEKKVSYFQKVITKFEEYISHFKKIKKLSVSNNFYQNFILVSRFM